MQIEIFNFLNVPKSLILNFHVKYVNYWCNYLTINRSSALLQTVYRCRDLFQWLIRNICSDMWHILYPMVYEIYFSTCIWICLNLKYTKLSIKMRPKHIKKYIIELTSTFWHSVPPLFKNGTLYIYKTFAHLDKLTLSTKPFQICCW
jgi:hypothetical protein